MGLAFVLLAAATVTASMDVTLDEANALSPEALGKRLLGDREHGPIVDAIINGRGMHAPSLSVNKVWLVEQMVPFNAKLCRSHSYEITMRSDDPDANIYTNARATHPVKIVEHDRLWVPPEGAASVEACAAAPAMASGFWDGGMGLERASELVLQAQTAFAGGEGKARFALACEGRDGVCGDDPATLLSQIKWSALLSVERVSPEGKAYSHDDPRPADADWGPAYVQFRFPYAAAKGMTWIVTVKRNPKIVEVRMRGTSVIYH